VSDISLYWTKVRRTIPLARAETDCGPIAKGEIYIVSGSLRDVNCAEARFVMDKNINDSESVPNWTCQVNRFRGWCTRPPDMRLELR
jgi:hypothetical protein